MKIKFENICRFTFSLFNFCPSELSSAVFDVIQCLRMVHHNPLVSFCAAGEKAIVCDQCGAQFQTEESLEAHRQIHTGMNTHTYAHPHRVRRGIMTMDRNEKNKGLSTSSLCKLAKKACADYIIMLIYGTSF